MTVSTYTDVGAAFIAWPRWKEPEGWIRDRYYGLMRPFGYWKWKALTSPEWTIFYLAQAHGFLLKRRRKEAAQALFLTYRAASSPTWTKSMERRLDATARLVADDVLDDDRAVEDVVGLFVDLDRRRRIPGWLRVAFPEASRALEEAGRAI